MSESLWNEYDAWLLEGKQTTNDKELLFEIVRDFTDRRGLRQEWEQIDDETKSEILEKWLEIVQASSSEQENAT